MKWKKWFIIIFISVYIIIGYFSAMIVGVKWDESATSLTRFLDRTRMAFIDGWIIKVIISLVFALIYFIAIRIICDDGNDT